LTVALSPNQRSIAETFIAQWSPRTDAYSAWHGDQWVAVREPLTPEVLAVAMRRTQPGPSVSAYFPDREGLTHVAALDFDTDDGLELAFRVARRIREMGVSTYVEPSRRGAHLWWPFAAQQPAWFARRCLRGALALAGIPANPKIELRPGMNGAPTHDGLGHALRLPLMRHPKTGQAFALHAPDGTPLPTALASLLLALDYPLNDDVLRVIAQHAPVEMKEIDRRLHGPRTYSERHRDTPPTVTDVVYERWGVILRPGRANRCFAPNHEDRHPSLSVTADDERLVCKAPHCILHNDGRGYGSIELQRLEL